MEEENNPLIPFHLANQIARNKNTAQLMRGNSIVPEETNDRIGS